jgi:purine-nucleoside phosphorylase
MPARLRPTAAIAADAILVGDPGRALLLAQELLQQPKMSNHARGLWGYSGLTPGGHELTIQATGMGGPSAAVVLRDLAELGVRRAVRVGTCAAVAPEGDRGRLKLGDPVVVSEALAERGGTAPPGEGGPPVHPMAPPDPLLTDRLLTVLGDVPAVVAVSRDTLSQPGQEAPPASEVADMQTASLFATAAECKVAIAALLIVAELRDGRRIPDGELEAAAKRAGAATGRVLSA